MTRRLLTLLVLPLLLPALLLAGCTSTPAPDDSGINLIAPDSRKPAPGLDGELLDGTGVFTLADYPGFVVVVNFWGSWCGPCVAEADDLEASHQSTKDEGVVFVGVNIRDDRDKALRFAQLRSTYPSVFDPSSRLALGFAVPPAATPTTIIIDRQARIAATEFGPVLQADLEAALTQLAAESR